MVNGVGRLFYHVWRMLQAIHCSHKSRLERLDEGAHDCQSRTWTARSCISGLKSRNVPDGHEESKCINARHNAIENGTRRCHCDP